ncbi:hypothetical protein [Halalkalibacillus halophilus]|uniref:hypothetical protein n=1 Tax=Halalkalibacillus halophilus TaxID=392827 RepID=UPI0003FF7E3B|nr:hypothetical protein [Halalkalibacillus halophilus]
MLLRKFLAFLVTSFATTILFVLLLGSELQLGIVLSTAIIGMYAVGGIISYGIPTSVLADVITKKLPEPNRKYTSLILHILFGMAFIFVLGIIADPSGMIGQFPQFWSSMWVFFLAATFASTLFWGVDEWLRSRPKES